MSNFELTIMLTEKFNEKAAKDYCDHLIKKITTKGITEIIFEPTNHFFESDEEKGIICNERNKINSGFSYKLNLPEKF
jgi:hypothetical protein